MKMIKQFIKGLRPKTIKLDTTLENKIEFAKFLAGRVEIYERNGDKFEINDVKMSLDELKNVYFNEFERIISKGN